MPIKKIKGEGLKHTNNRGNEAETLGEANEYQYIELMNRLHRRNRRRRIAGIVLTMLVIVFFLYQLIMAPLKIEQLKSYKTITIGIVTGTSNNHRSTGGGLEYKFLVGNKEYEGSTAYSSLLPDFCESLIGRSFPVIYSSKRISNNEILVTKYRFELYDLIQPDSLKWVEKYVQK